MSIPHLITSGVIAARLHESLPRVLYVLASRPHIRPVARAGILRLYNEHAVDLVRQEIEAINARRAKE